MDAMLKRQCAKLTYNDPGNLLRDFVSEMVIIAEAKKGRGLTQAERRKEETFQGALIAWMVQQMIGSEGNVQIAMKEIADYDCFMKMVPRSLPGGKQAPQVIYKGIQLKGLPSVEANSSCSLQEITH
ncbi:MAG: hypothetical protein ACO1QB_18650 [Verrucomicrobiales bacterium]